MMLIAETRPNRPGGVTDCRKVVVEITHRIGPAPSRKKPNPASAGDGMNVVSAITAAATKPVTGPRPTTVPKARGDHPRCQKRADHHADPVHREHGADTAGGKSEVADRIGHEHRQDQERSGVEDELRDEYRPQQRMMQYEACAFLGFLQGMPPRAGARAGSWMPDSSTTAITERAAAEPKAGAAPTHPTVRRPAQGRWQRPPFAPVRFAHWPRATRRRHQRWHQGGRCHAVSNGAADRDEAEQREQRQRHRPARSAPGCGQRRGAQAFRARHQPAPRDAVGEQARGDREQDERQRQRGLQQAGLAFADPEQDHRDIGAAASAICSADWAARSDQARRLKVWGRWVVVVADMGGFPDLLFDRHCPPPRPARPTRFPIRWRWAKQACHSINRGPRCSCK